MSTRGPGRGRLRRKRLRDGRAVYCGEWTGADGRPHRKQLSEDRRTAERILAEIIRQRDLAIHSMAREEGGEQSIAALRERYIGYLRTVTGAGQADAVEVAIKRIVEALAVARVRDLSPEAIFDYRRLRLAAGLANATVNKEVGAVRAMLKWGVRSRLIGANPLDCIAPLPMGRAYEKRPKRPLTEDEAVRFLVAADAYDAELAAYRAAKRTIAGGTKGEPYAEKDRRPHVPQAPLFRALLFTGARWGETTRATWADLDALAALLAFRAGTTKAKRQRTIPLRAEVLADLERLRHVHGILRGRPATAGELIFLSPKGEPWGGHRGNCLNLLNRLLGRAGIEKRDALGRSVGLHSLRHTCITMMARAGVPLLMAQKLVGHSDPKLTAALYTHLSGNDLRGAVEALPSLTVSAEERQKRQAAGGEVVSNPGAHPAGVPETAPSERAATPRKHKRMRRDGRCRARTCDLLLVSSKTGKGRRGQGKTQRDRNREIPEENTDPPSDPPPTPERPTP